MATAPSAPRHIAPETRQRILSPLHRLRGVIRFYITVDALALTLLLLAIWFWLGMAADYGFFKITGWDWVQILPTWLRAIGLLAVATFVTVLVNLSLWRLTRKLRPKALALLLERRYPKLLGDRLITAVELSDLDQAEKYGYSRAMILESVREASARVEKVSIRRVFNWARIYWRWFFVGAMTMGLLLLTLFAYLIWNQTLRVDDFAIRFGQISGIWFERNILLQDTRWPRRTYLELVDFPPSGELRIGKESASQRIRVRALKWVIADSDSDRAPEGWRSLTWSDLSSLEIDGSPRIPPLPAALLAPPTPGTTTPEEGDGFWTMDRIETMLEQPEVRTRLANRMNADDYRALDNLYEALDRTAGLAHMSRTMRKLEVPSDVRIYYWGEKHNDEAPMARQQQGIHEFSVVLTELTESKKFYIEAEDYSMYPYRKITLVPPPTLARLKKDEYLPAYQYHRPPADGSPEDLKGKKQERLDQDVSLTGAVSRIEIAAGSDVVLRGELDKPLESARIRYIGGPLNGQAFDVPLSADKLNIEFRFPNVTRPIDFAFEFSDTDNVKSQRLVSIKPVEDRAPDVNVNIEVIRRSQGALMVTPNAMIPISGTIRDDVGLTRLEYLATFSRVESAQATGLRAAIAAGIMGAASPSPSPRELFGAAGLADYLGRLSENRETANSVPALPLQTFEAAITDRDRLYPENRYGKDRLPELLKQPAANLEELKRTRHIAFFETIPKFEIGAKEAGSDRNVELSLKGEFLDLQERIRELQVGMDDSVPARYRLRLTIQAVDNNIETGPRSAQNRETFTFMVVPYQQLLAAMNEDEQKIAFKSRDLLDRMKALREDVEKVILRLPRVESEDFRPSASRLEDLMADLEKGSDTAREMNTDASRLLKEALVNRLPQSFCNTKFKLTDLLEAAINKHFNESRDALLLFRDTLNQRRVPDGGTVDAARQRVDELIRVLEQIDNLVADAIRVTQLAKQLEIVANLAMETQRILSQMLRDEEDHSRGLLGELDPKAPELVLNRGERKLVAVELGEGRDEKKGLVLGRLIVRATAPAGSGLIVPPPIMIPRLSKVVQIEITGGDKTGTFAVPVSFAFAPKGEELVRLKDDKPFVIKVTVK